ncbi:MAG: hypothetical protein WC353_00635 [Candidatus Peribacter sp.]|jgi:membrane protein DedA with SNARE-associated domain
MLSASPIALLLAYRYWILFPLALVEGPMVSIIAGLLVSQGIFALVPAYTIIFLGDSLPDTLYYIAGRLSHKGNFLKRYGHRFGITEHRLAALEYLWQHHTVKSVMISKWAYGLSTVLLLSAGLVRLPSRKYFSYVVPLAMAQSAALLALGYFFGSSYLVISKYIEGVGWIVTAGIVVFLVMYFFASRYAKRTFLQATK